MNKKKALHIEWPYTECYTAFIRGIYQEAGLMLPEDFYPEIEIGRVANTLIAKGMGIRLEQEDA